jgi:hypothetical protein
MESSYGGINYEVWILFKLCVPVVCYNRFNENLEYICNYIELCQFVKLSLVLIC